MGDGAKTTDALLEESEAKYRRLVDATATGYLILDDRGRVVDANGEYVRISGHQALEHILGRSVLEWTAPECHDRNAREIENCLQTGSVRHLEIEYLRPDGKLLPVEINASCVDTKEGRRILSLCRDITRRKQGREALRRSERRFRSYFEQGLVGMAATSPEGRWLEVNQRICEILRYPREELLSKTWPELTHPEDLPKDAAQFTLLLKGEIDHYTLDKRFIRKDGSVVYTTINICAIRTELGTLDHIFGLMEDVTARHEAEEALQQEQRTLRHLLQSSDHERQLIAYEVHDGLAQYLAASIMQLDVYSHLKDSQPKEAKRAYEAARTMLRQAHGESRRLISGVRPPILDEAGIVAAISHLVNEQKRPDGPKIEFRSNVEFERLAPILENAVYRIFQEALTNACRHSQSKKVRVELVQAGNRLHIEILDHGVGFLPQDVDESRFGLAGIRQRARLLGGKAFIDSKLGRGTRIAVELPLVLP
jgi:PAS domain S-box-containing protein